MKPVVDEDMCIGCGKCEELCPEIFEIQDDGYSHVLVLEPACPTSAITIEE
jgi:ferredoxin